MQQKSLQLYSNCYLFMNSEFGVIICNLPLWRCLCLKRETAGFFAYSLRQIQKPYFNQKQIFIKQVEWVHMPLSSL